MFTMTYYGSQMVVKNYNIMGVAKAALEAAVRYIAAEVGPKGIRVHAISPGPLATRAASGIPEFDELMDKAQVQGADAQPGEHRRRRGGDRVPCARRRQADHRQRHVYRRRLSHHRLSALAVVQTDHLRDAGRALAALDLDHDAIMDPQAVRRHILGFGDANLATQP